MAKLGTRQQQALEVMEHLDNKEWRAGCFKQFQDKGIDLPPFLRMRQGEQDKVLDSLEARGLVERVGQDQYQMGVYRKKL